MLRFEASVSEASESDGVPEEEVGADSRRRDGDGVAGEWGERVGCGLVRTYVEGIGHGYVFHLCTFLAAFWGVEG